MTRIFLTYGVVAGPLYLAVGLAQIAARPGFDITKHALSLMENGDLGWMQIANFFVAGLFTVFAAIGHRRATAPGRGSFWTSLLLGIYGISLIGAGIFTADPALGFPVGTAANEMSVSWHGIMHFVCGGLGFLALIAATFVSARRFAKRGEKGWATYSILTGVIFFAAFFGIASGTSNSVVTVAFYGAVALAWSWISLTSAKLRRNVPSASSPTRLAAV